MIPNPLSKITEADLIELVSNRVPEGKQIEYKSQLSIETDKEKREFLSDVSSFANTVGGDLIYGIEELDRLPISVTGLRNKEIDQTLAKMENLIKSGISPRIAHLVETIELSSGRIAILIRVKQSWIGPHRVTIGGHDKFYSRTSNGKFPMDVSELRDAFLLSNSIAERIQEFRTERAIQIYGGNTPVPVDSGPKIAFHLIPFQSFTSRSEVDFLSVYDDPNRLTPIRSYGRSVRINLDGVVTYSGGIEALEPTESYTQLYRNGIIEVVTSRFFFEKDSNKSLFSIDFERSFLGYLKESLPLVQALGIEPPIFVFLSLLGVEGFTLGLGGERADWTIVHPLQDDVLTLPESVIDNLEVNVEEVLRPIYDLIWNAVGLRRSFNFDDDGKWDPPLR